ncbi:MAG: ABC transporter permease [Synergistaceae bacterium]|nr:ABC transporter permease [Synergistaceae bacterium]
MNAKKSRGAFYTVVWLIILSGLWEIAPRVGLANKYLLPTLSSTIRVMAEQISNGALGWQILTSLALIAWGCLLSVLLSAVIAFLCIYSPLFESLFRALCTIFNPLPGLAVLPLIMMWFGIGTGAVLVLIIHGVIWPLVTELIAGFRSVPAVYRDFSRNIGLNAFQETFSVLIYAVMPNFLAGLSIGWGRAWRALIGAEMVFGMMGDYGGVGYYIYLQRAYANIPRVMAGVLAIVIIGILVDQLIFRMIERITVERWGMSGAGK